MRRICNLIDDVYLANPLWLLKMVSELNITDNINKNLKDTLGFEKSLWGSIYSNLQNKFELDLCSRFKDGEIKADKSEIMIQVQDIGFTWNGYHMRKLRTFSSPQSKPLTSTVAPTPESLKELTKEHKAQGDVISVFSPPARGQSTSITSSLATSLNPPTLPSSRGTSYASTALLEATKKEKAARDPS